MIPSSFPFSRIHHLRQQTLGSPDVVKVLDGHGDVVLGGEEEAVGDLAGILGVGGFSVRVPRIEFHPVLHLCPIKARHHFVHYVLQSFVSPEIGKVKAFADQ